MKLVYILNTIVWFKAIGCFSFNPHSFKDYCSKWNEEKKQFEISTIGIDYAILYIHIKKATRLIIVPLVFSRHIFFLHSVILFFDCCFFVSLLLCFGLGCWLFFLWLCFVGFFLLSSSLLLGYQIISLGENVRLLMDGGIVFASKGRSCFAGNCLKSAFLVLERSSIQAIY